MGISTRSSTFVILNSCFAAASVTVNTRFVCHSFDFTFPYNFDQKLNWIYSQSQMAQEGTAKGGSALTSTAAISSLTLL